MMDVIVGPAGTYERVPTADFLGGKAMRAYFPNGYGASVISHSFSYGGPQGFYELAVLHGDKLWGKRDHGLCYRTPITEDVIGWLTPELVVELLWQIARLPVRVRCAHTMDWRLNDYGLPFTGESRWTGAQMKGARS